MSKVTITLPFSGFYESLHDASLDDALIQYFDYEGCGDYPEHPKVEDWSECSSDLNWSKIHEEYAKAYNDYIASEYGLKTLEFQELDSPMYYNFETDRIHSTIELKELRELLKKVDKETLKETIKERFTSCSGFISFYSNSLDEWLLQGHRNWDNNQWRTVLIAYISEYTDELHYDSYHALSESAVNIISDNMPDKWVKIADELYEQSKAA